MEKEHEFEITVVVVGEDRKEAYSHLFDEVQYLASLDNLIVAWYDNEDEE